MPLVIPSSFHYVIRSAGVGTYLILKVKRIAPVSKWFFVIDSLGRAIICASDTPL
jgi:hypothetical protein